MNELFNSLLREHPVISMAVYLGALLLLLLSGRRGKAEVQRKGKPPQAR